MGEPAIHIEGLRKVFTDRKNQSVEVLKGIDLDIEKGDIYGIIGLSGAGKSTFVRCLNRLEEITSGTIAIDGVDIASLSKRELAAKRQEIGMIFQHFNLFDSKTVRDNVAYPLKIAGVDKQVQQEKVSRLLEEVGLADKADYYPSQLSGGQKQRVGIARAMANDPKVLLCDEATSALDPLTTLSVLDLIKFMNKEHGVTVVMISHEINVMRYACNHVAVIENGLIVEKGPAHEVLDAPCSETGQMFLSVEKQLSQTWASEKPKVR
ncbi:Methionine import ATP-binding protein MetN [Slackia heliotrinireducens]|uniref:ABC-type metal ion transport system, ATPase component n=1 Tax=Slackia heliotrinireducens (strain ATCC 29202 / DSM 20476 / NCTC 11029 / RHS 1) TaxID=471855 RepID=C7N2T0_SLAHD|nr:methionine ABC transporter ATP-binding protein [Slackia heliotrinireducens]ACV23588.1 ABC-type metal ion transport system, ATPase component [Slackia heliotrinireducens DSM 20476]VEH03046.1 Methionine import ATP-binding protein MetN [Slackia heliotrinireducens]